MARATLEIFDWPRDDLFLYKDYLYGRSELSVGCISRILLTSFTLIVTSSVFNTSFPLLRDRLFFLDFADVTFLTRSMFFLITTSRSLEKFLTSDAGDLAAKAPTSVEANMFLRLLEPWIGFLH